MAELGLPGCEGRRSPWRAAAAEERSGQGVLLLPSGCCCGWPGRGEVSRCPGCGPPGQRPATSPSSSARRPVYATEWSVGRGRSRQSLHFPSLSPGDAVLVLWRTSHRELAKTISLVLQCSRQIQKKYGSRDTPVGQKVRLKIGTGAVPGADAWHSHAPQGASPGQGMRGSLLGPVPKESISCEHSRGQR